MQTAQLEQSYSTARKRQGSLGDDLCINLEKSQVSPPATMTFSERAKYLFDISRSRQDAHREARMLAKKYEAYFAVEDISIFLLETHPRAPTRAGFELAWRELERRADERSESLIRKSHNIESRDDEDFPDDYDGR